MENLITIVDNEPVVSHRVIAQNVGVKAINIAELIQDHIEDFEEFGQCRFQTETVKNSVGAVNSQKTYLLNEPQATLLMTYLKNTDVVRRFKITLVKAFYDLKYVVIKELAQRVEALEAQKVVAFKRVIGSPLSESEKETIRELRAQNWGTVMIAQYIGCSERAVRRVFRPINKTHTQPSLFGSVKKLFGA